MSTSFEVAQVRTGNHRLDMGSVAQGITALTTPSQPLYSDPEPRQPPRFEATSSRAGGVHAVAFHPFMAAIHLAYDHHLPLRLTPDHVWLVIAQGFANHVRLHAEGLRGRLVGHEGRLELIVRRDDFVRGGDNPWPEVFEAFSGQIRTHVGKRHDLVVGEFSTTTPLDKTVAQLTLLDGMQHYFDLVVVTRCGIPRIILAGTSADWRALRARAQVLREFDLDWWIAALDPILAAFVDASEGRIDRAFWAAMCKPEGGSGGPYYGGWAKVLFPYLAAWTGELVRSEQLDTTSDTGPAASDLPGALGAAPMTWRYGFDVLPMRVLGGFVGVTQDPSTLELAPGLGWAVCYAD
jgi:hypothetical protein